MFLERTASNGSLWSSDCDIGDNKLLQGVNYDGCLTGWYKYCLSMVNGTEQIAAK